MTNDEGKAGFAVDPWTGEFRDGGTEQRFRDWAFPEDLRIFRRTVIAITALYTSLLIGDLAATGLDPSLYWAAADRVAVLLAGIACFHWLGRARGPAAMDRIAILFAVAIELGAFFIFGMIEHGPPEFRRDEFLMVPEMIMVSGAYLFLPNRFGVQMAVGWTSAAVVLALPLLLGSPSAGQIVSRAMFLALANVLGMLLALRLHVLRRVEYGKILEEQRANASLESEITRRKASEEQKDRLFSIIAHDLRGPFNVLLGYSSMLAEEAHELSGDEVERYGRAMHESGKRVFRLLENLLHWTRLQMNRVSFAPGPQDLAECVQRAFDDIAAAAATKGVRLRSDVADLAVSADATMLDAILRNLVGNGVKFTFPGGHVDVRARIDGESVVIEVIDDGVGIAPEALEHLFDGSGERSTHGTSGEPGTGLGLLVCRDLVARHGGRLEVESVPERGSTFRFRLPRATSLGTPPDSTNPIEPEIGGTA
ncbi:MAG TPA: HAMP domain-containing sensor histidine kinase [Candidatus Binatia bacterium]|nr:HAMP domain-containing sensor histidine kinase [Candidatus Binatia bacterium]